MFGRVKWQIFLVTLVVVTVQASEEKKTTPMPAWAKMGGKVALKLGMNYFLCPICGAMVDFHEAFIDFNRGNTASGILNIASGLADIATCGISSLHTELANEAGEKAALEATKELVKDAPETVVKETMKACKDEIAEGMGKAVIEEVKKEVSEFTAKSAAKVVAKELMQTGGDVTLQTSGITAGKVAFEALKEPVKKIFQGDAVKKVYDSVGAKAFKETAKKVLQEGENVKDVVQFSLSGTKGLAKKLKYVV